MSDSSKIQIRTAREEDIPSVVILWREMMDFHRALDDRFEMSKDAEEQFQLFLSECMDRHDHRVLVAEKDGALVGYVLGSINNNVPVFRLERYGFIADLSVRKEHRKRGIGRRLVSEIKVWFRENEVEAIQLNVSEMNPDGLQFWGKCGFRDFLKTLWCDLRRSFE